MKLTEALSYGKDHLYTRLHNLTKALQEQKVELPEPELTIWHPYISWTPKRTWDQHRDFYSGLPSRASVVYSVLEDEFGLSLQVGFAFCSPKDSFSRRAGRELATERFFEQPTFVDIKPGLGHRDIRDLITVLIESAYLTELPGAPVHKLRVISREEALFQF